MIAYPPAAQRDEELTWPLLMARSDPMAEASLPDMRARSRPGTAIVAMMPMIATTISSSMSVNPLTLRILLQTLLENCELPDSISSVDRKARGWSRLREHTGDHRLERRLVDVERTGDGGPHRDLDRDDDAAFFIRIHNPAQAAQRDLAVAFARPFQPVHRAKHRFEHLPNVVVRPRTGRPRAAFDGGRGSEVGAPQPHVHSDPVGHDAAFNSCCSASTVVTGWRQVKFRHTYAAVVPSTGSIAATNGKLPARPRRRCGGTRRITVNGRYCNARPRAIAPSSCSSSAMTTCCRPAVYTDSAAAIIGTARPIFSSRAPK